MNDNDRAILAARLDALLERKIPIRSLPNPEHFGGLLARPGWRPEIRPIFPSSEALRAWLDEAEKRADHYEAMRAEQARAET